MAAKRRSVTSEELGVSYEGNNGGSYVTLRQAYDRHGKDKPGVVYLEVGETCVRTVHQEVSVVALAMILTRARDIGFRAMIEAYMPGMDAEFLSLLEPVEPASPTSTAASGEGR